MLQFEGRRRRRVGPRYQHARRGAEAPCTSRRDEVDAALVEKERDLLDEALALEAEKIKTEAEQVLALPDQQIQDPNNLEKMTSSHGRAEATLKKAEGMLKNKPKVIEGRMGRSSASGACWSSRTPTRPSMARRRSPNWPRPSA